jgi:hypothetical protein
MVMQSTSDWFSGHSCLGSKDCRVAGSVRSGRNNGGLLGLLRWENIQEVKRS